MSQMPYYGNIITNMQQAQQQANDANTQRYNDLIARINQQLITAYAFYGEDFTFFQ